MWISMMVIAATAAAAAPARAAPASSVDALRGQRRILLVAAPERGDARAEAQRRALSGWAAGAAERDVSLVALYGTQVVGASDSAAALRRRYRLSPTRFEALLIGKDGHVAMRSPQPIDARTLQGTIDAMPMRRAGER